MDNTGLTNPAQADVPVRDDFNGARFVSIERGQKAPKTKDWTESTLSLNDLQPLLNAGMGNAGIILGEASGGIVDIDFDCPEAVLLAPFFLPETLGFGRKSNPRSHLLFKLIGTIGETKQFRHKGKMLVELRSTGGQTVFPGSQHHTGELIEWTGKGDEAITKIAYEELAIAVRKIAAASLLVQDWSKGSRHDAALALAGGLLRAGWSEGDAEQFVAAIATAAGDDDVSNRVKGIITSAAKLDDGEKATGFPKLASIFGDEVVTSLLKFLGIGRKGQTARKGGDSGDGGSTRKVAELIKCIEDAELFNVPGEPINTGTFMTVPVDGHKETYRIGSEECKAWLRFRYHQETGDDIGSPNTMQNAIETIRSKAFFSPQKHKTFVRVGAADGKFYYDLGDDLWRVVEIDAEGWRILTDSPVKFIRSRGYEAQADPERGGNIKDLRRFINVSDEDDWVLLVGWIISTFGYRPEGAYANLCLTGTQDASKSTATRLIRLLVDPNTVPLRHLPKEGRDLMVSARHNWLPAYDNISTIPEAMSDALCRLATGGGQSSRENYSDGDEFVFEARRPVIMNAIGDVVTRPDLVDRTISIEMPPLDDSARMTEAALYAEYRKVVPGILGAIFDAVSMAVRESPNVKLPRLPRMADLTEFVTAAEPA
nr:bifunctional DNA primase/polymerase [Acidobacteriota bacterium]